MPKTDMSKLLDEAKAFAADLFGRTGAVPLTFILFGRGRKAVVHAPDLPSDAVKDRVAAAVREFARRAKPVAIATACESWMVMEPLADTTTPRQALDAPPLVPSEHPRRIEAVFVSVESSTGGVEAAFARILREQPGDEKSKGTLGPWEPMPTWLTGRFGGWFRKDEPKA